MRRQGPALLAFVFALVLCLALPSSALAWSNGGNNGNGFGTHDWIMYHAVYFSRKQGANWVNRSVAMGTTDDPDMIFRDPWDHNYDRWNGEDWGNAQIRVAYYYARTVYYLKRGDNRNASKMAGIMSHYYADACEPLHTQESRYENASNLALYHTPYEHDVDLITHKASQNTKWLHYDGYQHVDSAKAVTVAAATTAHKYYSALLGEFMRHGFDKKVRSITGKQIGRATNGLADLLVSAQEDAAQRATSPDVGAETGVATDGSRYFVTGPQRAAVFDSAWHSVVATANPTAGTNELTDPALGTACAFGGRLYVPAANSDGSHQLMLLLDPSTLSTVATFTISQVPRPSALAVMPSQGAHGIIYVASGTDSKRLFKYDLASHAYLGSLKFKSTLPGRIVGLGNRNKKLLAATSPVPDVGKIYTVDGHGRTALVFTSSIAGQHGGIAFLKGDLVWMVGAGAGSGRVHRIHLPIK